MALPQATTSLLSHCWEASISVYLNPLNLRWPILLLLESDPFWIRQNKIWNTICKPMSCGGEMSESRIHVFPPRCATWNPGLDDFTVYLIMAGSNCWSDHLLAGWTFRVVFFGGRFCRSCFILIFTVFPSWWKPQSGIQNRKNSNRTNQTTTNRPNGWDLRHGDLHVVRVDFGHLPGLRRFGQYCAQPELVKHNNFYILETATYW